MDNITNDSLILNDTNETCLRPLLWTQEVVNSRQPQLYICIIAVIIHVIFWSQLAFCPSVRQKSMQWIYAYLSTDIFLLLRFFFTYFVHTMSTECDPSETWIYFNCYFEATVDNYFNILEVYILLVLNICRYVQISYNRDVYRVHTSLLIISHLCIYLIPLFVLLIQFFINWAVLDVLIATSCDANYTNIYAEIFNIIIAFALPIFLNILVICASIRHVHLTSTLRQAQHHVSAREKYHRSLVIQFLLFYIIWLALWSPNIIVYQFTSGLDDLTNIVRLLNFIEIVLDPIIIAALDIRFWHAWKKFWVYLRKTKFIKRPNQRQLRPATVNMNVFSINTQRLQTTAF